MQTIVIIILKILIFFLRTFTRNSATALPGLYLEKYFPKTLRKLFNNFENVIFITGTNGKTTTSRMICHLLDQNGYKYVNNSSGSNLIRGIASEFLKKSNFFGKFKEKIAVLEVEEATIPKLVKFIKPNVIIVTNIFRDQLDAYGEIDKTYRHIKNAITSSNNPKLILNLNDERVRSLAEFTNNEVQFISFNQEYLKFIKFENKNKSRVEKVQNSYEINSIKQSNLEFTDFKIQTPNNKSINFKIKVPGMHNTFNATSAILGFCNLINKSFDHKDLKLDLFQFEPTFGRGEKIIYNQKTYQILLAKNPAGMNLNLELVKNIKNNEAILFILNDKIADGRDVSWIWDCDFKIIKNINQDQIFTTGHRKFDMTLALKFSLNFSDEFNNQVLDSIENSIKYFSNSKFEKIYVLATYTAMREFRDKLGEKTKVKKMYE